MTKLSGNQKRKMRSASRLYAVQALFQMEQSDAGLDKVRREFLEYRFGAEQVDGEEMIDGDVDFFARLLEQAVNWQVKIDQMTDRALVAKWPIARIDPTTLRRRWQSWNTWMWPRPFSRKARKRVS